MLEDQNASTDQSKPVTRAKFYCHYKVPNPDGSVTLHLHAASGTSEDDKRFFASTPNGQLSLHTVNPDAAASFEQGKAYYLDFTPA